MQSVLRSAMNNSLCVLAAMVSSVPVSIQFTEDQGISSITREYA